MSSFKRAIKSTNDSTQSHIHIVDEIPITGIKPWIHNGLGIISIGNKQLDDLIGGGIVLGTVTCVEIDHLTTYGDSLISCYLAESISHQHNVLIINENESSVCKVIESLPYNKNIGSGISNDGQDVCIDKNIYSIVWGNGKYFDFKIETDIDKNDFNPPVYCCSYDLSRRIQSNLLVHANIKFCSLTREVVEDNLLSYTLKSIKSFLMKCMNTNKKSVNRIYLPLDQLIMQYLLENKSSNEKYTLQISKFLLQIKHMIRDTRTSVLITIRPQLISSYVITKLRYISDNLLTIESFEGRTHSIPYEFKDFHGFLLIQKLQNYGTLASYRPSGTRFGIKRNRYKLNIEPLHLPPEGNRTFAGTGGSVVNNSHIIDSTNQGLNHKNDDIKHHHNDNHHHNHENSSVTNSNNNNNNNTIISSLLSSKAKLLEVEAMNAIMKIDLSHNETNNSIAKNPYKISLSEKLAAIKAARLVNNDTNDSINTTTTRPITIDEESYVPLLQPSNMCRSQKYDF